MFKKTGEHFYDSTLGNLYERVDPVAAILYHQPVIIVAIRADYEDDLIVESSQGWRDAAVGDGLYLYSNIKLLSVQND